MEQPAHPPGAGPCPQAGIRVTERPAVLENAEVVVVAIDRREFEARSRPVRIEFLDENLREARRDALAHLGAMDSADDIAVTVDLDPRVHRERRSPARGEFRRRVAIVEAPGAVCEGQATAGRGTGQNESAATEHGRHNTRTCERKEEAR